MKMNKTILVILLSTMTLGFGAQAAPLTAEQEQQVRELVRDTLIKNPQILEESIQALQAQQAEKQQAQMKDVLKTEANALYNDPTSPRIGAKDAKLVLVSFTDYNCPYCKRFDPQLEEIVKKYPDVAVVFKPLPFKGPTSVESTQLVLTLWEKDPKAFQALHQKFMQKQGMLTEENIKQALKATGNEKLVVNDKSKETIGKNLELAEKLGVQGTPATVIGDEMVSGAIDMQQLESIVKAELAKAKK